jgi:hypothetical protein
MISRFVTPLYQHLSHKTTGTQNDMLMWLMSEAKGAERSIEGLARRLLTINIAAVSLTSVASDDIPSAMILS